MAAERRPAELDTAFMVLDESLDRVDNLADTLASRLMPLLGPDHSPPDPGMAEDTPERSPIVQRVYSQRDRVERTADRLRALLDRLEL